ncbi:cytochrome C biogenesis protein CcdA [Brachybacterium vulturis]|uniref:Cytochrome C biogenesis protein CcdA n=1 Tax=Brachybacterium vulturis TaxID=2017484 RepID=A0A291GL01_9MICO|nr:MFS transporter [Brachybacterium vulturis]ATG50634.1 cytochrome C biogenesis protein CcdA [Brachybacterium vulturis]
MVLGMPRKLVFGYIALAIFMAGDGFELTFLSRYLVTEHGFTPQQAGLCFTVYGLVVAISAWTTGVLAETFGPKRLMLLGGVLWIALHTLFLSVGIADPVLAVATYGLRGIAYPLFMYSFVVLIAESTEPARLASAMGWFWAAFSVGLGTLGAFIPSVTIPAIGELATLWMAPAFVGTGTLICLFLVPGAPKGALSEQVLTRQEKTRELLRGVTILAEKPQISLAVVIRVLCNLTLYGFPLMMPLYLTGVYPDSQEWFTQAEWIRLWAVISAIQILTNILWGRLGDRYGWMRQMRWFGFVGMAAATLGFGYFPHLFGSNLVMMYVAGVLFSISVTAFVPMGAIFPALAPEHRGAAISAHNLASGLTTFLGPAIVTVFQPLIGSLGVIWVYAVLMLLGTVTTVVIRPPQPGITDAAGRPLSRAEKARARAEAAACAGSGTGADEEPRLVPAS